MATFKQVEALIDATPALQPHRAILLYDWGDNEEHWQWVLSTPVDEVVEWAEVVEEMTYGEDDEEQS